MQRQGCIRIHTPSPYENIDANTAEWLRALRNMWPLWKNSPAISDNLFSFFSRSEDPFKSALSLMVSCGDFYSGKHNSFAYCIMINFSKWVKTQNPMEIPKPLKLDAIKLMTKQHNADLLKLVIETFKLKEDKEMFVEHINELVKKKKYKEACQLASFLNLHEHFGIMEFLMPLIYQDKVCVVEMFLNGSKKHQLELAVFLDNVIGKEDVMQESLTIIQNLNIPDVKFTFVKYKPLSKLLTKLIKTYKLPSLTCPNMNRKKGKGILQFLMHKRYVEKTISGESWTEMVLEAIGDDESLHARLVEDLTFYRELKEALTWAERLGIPKKSWPKKLIEYSQSGVETERPIEENWDEEDWEDFKEFPSEVKYHKFPLEESQIKLIDTASGFNDFIVEITNGVFIVGIDAEWKPSFGLKRTDLALIQVATYQGVYILDVISLVSAAPSPLWERFANFLFDNPNVLKVGFDIRTDIHLVKEIFRRLHCLKSGSDAGFLDLAVLWQTLVYNHKFVFPFASTSNDSANLNRLIQLCLGETLDKSDQFSNWENRPLRKSQILYAAIDAYCLLEAYDVIVRESKSQNIPISDVIDEILLDTPTKKPKKKGGKHQDE